MRKSIVLGSIAALGLAGQALAEESFSYSFLEADYITADIDGLDDNADGFGISGSIGFTPMFHGFLDYANLDYDGTDVSTWEIGGGINHTLTPIVDLVGRLGYAKFDVDGGGDDDGFALQAGVRTRPATSFELEGLLHYVDLSDTGDNTSLRVNARYFFAPEFAVGAGLEYDSDATVWNVGVRWNFNNK
jgi:hypothetical protein